MINCPTTRRFNSIIFTEGGRHRQANTLYCAP
uniref:Uncharacterized protein n=1 Tax=Anguilla anguilla TaxID=7936 RepID=A0A0E9TA82_ANGAN